MTINPATLQAIAAATGSNPVQQATGAAAVAAAVSAGSQQMATQILNVTQASGVSNNGGNIAIFYAGYNINYQNARDCRDVSGGRGYIIDNTAAGPAASLAYDIMNSEVPGSGQLTNAIASANYAATAGPLKVGFSAGGLPTSLMFTVEVPTIAANGSPSIIPLTDPTQCAPENLRNFERMFAPEAGLENGGVVGGAALLALGVVGVAVGAGVEAITAAAAGLRGLLSGVGLASGLGVANASIASTLSNPFNNLADNPELSHLGPYNAGGGSGAANGGGTPPTNTNSNFVSGPLMGYQGGIGGNQSGGGIPSHLTGNHEGSSNGSGSGTGHDRPSKNVTAPQIHSKAFDAMRALAFDMHGVTNATNDNTASGMWTKAS